MSAKKPLFLFNLQWILLLQLVCLLLFLIVVSYAVLGAWNNSYRASLEEDSAVALDEYNSFFREQVGALTAPAGAEKFADPDWVADYLSSRESVDFFVVYAGGTPVRGSGRLDAPFLRLFERMIADALERGWAVSSTELTDWETLIDFQPALGRQARLPGRETPELPVLLKIGVVPLEGGDVPRLALTGRLLNNDDDFVGRSFRILDGEYQHRASANTADGLRVTGTFTAAGATNGDYQRPEIIRAIQTGVRTYTVVTPSIRQRLASVFSGTPVHATYVMTTPLFNYGGELVGAVNISNGPEKPRTERGQIISAILLTSALILILGVALSYAVSWKLAQPLRGFTGLVNDIALAGQMEPAHLQTLEDWDQPAQVREYDALRRAVASLARAQYEKQREIKRHVDELEHVVAERTEDLQIALQEAEASNTMKTRFLTNVSHDVRTPLNSICGFSSLLRQELYGELNEKQREYVGLIDDCAHQVLRLFSDLLDLAVAERGQLVLHPEKIDPAELISAAVAQFSAQALNRSITLTTELPPALPVVYADRSRLMRALANILDNALKYTPEGGRVSARAEASGGDVALIVRDNGRGIDTEHLARVFEEFYRAEGGKGKTAGFGLGLATARGIARLHGGLLEIDSEPDVFTEVRIILPVV
ncbi:MAG: HAMP domain-containing histidine kinase [Gracilibacteraceae bacterium]|jgi:signal transduction histidine kinase|nr:HAMP domain-containing histidine kinase [Gracilibacteraceae bacterium]